ncbi:hypothetical protein ACFWOT_18000 [Streptomyces sp. NPDC058440]|uniref:hypothetical protein n=1 Tax=Streptomyces sp. NPDC058440 TaxID=3346501 RepID=UPI00364A3025
MSGRSAVLSLTARTPAGVGAVRAAARPVHRCVANPAALHLTAPGPLKPASNWETVMGPSNPQPRRTPPLDSLRELAPGAELVKIRANPRNWSQAVLLAAYTWPQYEGDRLVPLDHGSYPHDSHDTAPTIGEFLSRYRQLPVVRQLQAGDAAYTFLVELARPSWELSGGDSQ